VLLQGWSASSPSFDGVSFVIYYIELPIMLVMYLRWKIIKRTKLVKLEDMDLETDRYYAEVDAGPLVKGWKSNVKSTLTWLF
jgi:AAT family amino acid transporter